MTFFTRSQPSSTDQTHLHVLQPTAFSDMNGRNGVDKHTAFTGLMINNLFVVIAAFLTPFLMKVRSRDESNSQWFILQLRRNSGSFQLYDILKVSTWKSMTVPTFQLVGMRLSLIVGSMCSIPITLALFVPYNMTILIGQAINGIGKKWEFILHF